MSNFRSLQTSAVAAAICASAFGAIVNPASAQVVVVQAGSLHIGDGRIINNATVVIRDGIIEAVGANLRPPAGARVINVPEGSITPGLIDANAVVDSGQERTPPPAAGRGRGRGPRPRGEDFYKKLQEALTHADDAERCSLAADHNPSIICFECGHPENCGDENQTAALGAFAVGVNQRVSLAESSSEVIPETRVIDSINLRAPDFMRLARGGVTTVYVTADSAAVISSQGAVVHTGGPAEGRVIREVDSVKATMGTEPSRVGQRNGTPRAGNVTFNTRRPTTRMGVVWVFRKAFYDAAKWSKGLPVSGADTPQEVSMPALNSILEGRIPLRIQARMQHDILTAFRLADEFNLSFVLEEATEAHRCIDELKAHGTQVVYGPIFIDPTGLRARSGEVSGAQVNTLRTLLDAGITTALTAHDLRDEDGLARQAMYAMRFGLSRAEALRAVTLTPAEILGLDDQLGTVQKDKRGDLVVWSGKPFDATSRPVVVIIGGEVVVDRLAN